MKHHSSDVSDGLYHLKHARYLRVRYTDKKRLLLLELQTLHAAKAV